jgi:hypothetical protein
MPCDAAAATAAAQHLDDCWLRKTVCRGFHRSLDSNKTLSLVAF